MSQFYHERRKSPILTTWLVFVGNMQFCYTMSMIIFLSTFLALAVPALTTTTGIRNGVRDALWDAPFDVTATVSHPYSQFVNGSFVIRDNAGETCLLMSRQGAKEPPPHAGDLVRALGFIRPTGLQNVPSAYCTNLTVISHGHPPEPTKAIPERLLEGKYNGRFISIEGVVLDTFRDEIDTHSFFLVLDCDGEIVYAIVSANQDILEKLQHLTGSKVRVSGCGSGGANGHRSMIGQTLSVTDFDDIQILHAALDAFDVPEVTAQQETAAPSTISRLGRRKAFGHVIAKRHGGKQLLLKTRNGNLAAVELALPGKAPEIGEFVEVVGYAETDLYTIHFVGSVWRHNESAPIVPVPPEDVTATTLLTNGKGEFRINPRFHGCNVRLSGIVRDIHNISDYTRSISLHCENFTIPVDVSTNPEVLQDLTIGCKISVTGICLLNTERWSPHALFPHATGITITINSPTSIKILSRPSWWTVGRMAAVVVVLLVLLALFFLWNRALRRIVEHRSRQLMREEMARTRTNLKMEERTRLAVELHDSFSQSLTGVALQIDIAQLAATEAPETVKDLLESARQKMQSCRDSLRNCLWDLRSHVLDERKLSEAIRKTLAPKLESATATIDCKIDCGDLSANSLHAILCIIRELVINATRHGRATALTISSSLKNERIGIIVSDNGSGFDVPTRPGTKEGHFGLQGINERVLRLGGEMFITSAPGHGCTVTIQNLDANG